jgi:hydrogenase maturation protease
MPNREILIIGVGNAYRSDDAVGLVTVLRLTTRLKLRQQLDGIKIIEQSGEGTALIDCWHNAATVLLVDAVSSGGAPGTIYRIDASSESVPAKFFRYSTHAFSVAEAVELARTLDELPPRFIIYGIEGANYQTGGSLSAVVKEAIEIILDRLMTEIAELKKACTTA